PLPLHLRHAAVRGPGDLSPRRAGQGAVRHRRRAVRPARPGLRPGPGRRDRSLGHHRRTEAGHAGRQPHGPAGPSAELEGAEPIMIVDVHCHTPTHVHEVPEEDFRAFSAWRTDREVITSNTWADFDAAIEPADVAIVFNIAAADPLASTGLSYRPEDTNTATAAYVASRPDKAIGFMSVDPTRPEVWEEVERARSLGLVGVKLGANYQEFEPLGAPAMEFYRYCEREGLPILFHQGASPIRHAPLRYTFPLVTDEVAIAFPEIGRASCRERGEASRGVGATD